MSTPEQQHEPVLKQGVGTLGVVVFGAGTAIGVSIFTVLAPAAEVAGAGLLIAAALASIPMVFFALCYAWLASVLPRSGATYEWPRRFLHPLAGFAVAWLRILGMVGAITVLGRVLVSYLGTAVALPLPGEVAIAAVITLVFAVNYCGVQLAARAQSLLMLLLVAVFGLFAVSGAGSADWGRLGPLTAAGWPAILAAIPLMISLFLGIESAVEIGEEVRDPRRTIPRGISLAILLTLCIYLAVSAVALGVLGPGGLAASEAPLLDAARVPLGQWAGPVVVGAAVVAILQTLNALAMIFSRCLFAMGRTGVLPVALARVHPRFGTPSTALLVAWLCSMAGLLLPSSLVFLLLAVNIPTMVKYMACTLCAAKVVEDHPQLASTAGLSLAPQTVRICGYLGSLLALGIILAGVGADWRPYALVILWLLVGLGYWFVRGSPGEREQVRLATAAAAGGKRDA